MGQQIRTCGEEDAQGIVEVHGLMISRTHDGVRAHLELRCRKGSLPACAVASWSVKSASGRTLAGEGGAFSFGGQERAELELETHVEPGNQLVLTDGPGVSLKILTDSGFKTRAFVSCDSSGTQKTCEYQTSPMSEAELACHEAMRRNALAAQRLRDDANARKEARRAARRATREEVPRPASNAAGRAEDSRQDRDRERRASGGTKPRCPRCNGEAQIVLTLRGKRALSCPSCGHYRLLDI